MSDPNAAYNEVCEENAKLLKHIMELEQERDEGVVKLVEAHERIQKAGIECERLRGQLEMDDECNAELEERIQELKEGLISVRERLAPHSNGQIDWFEARRARRIISKLLEAAAKEE